MRDHKIRKRKPLSAETKEKLSKSRKAFMLANPDFRKQISDRNRGRTFTLESKAKISAGRKAWLLANPNKHPWKRREKFNSVPCEKLKQFLRNEGINFIEEYSPIKDRGFSIDIAFPDIKLGIEVNGNQHYNSDGSLKPYYQSRHDLIQSAGWKLIELHYVSCTQENFKLLIQKYEQPSYTKYFEERAKRILEQEQKRKSILPYGVKNSQNASIKWEPYKQLILDSGINFQKFGWVSKVAKILSISTPKVNGWMKKRMPEFYLTCFHKRSKVSALSS